MLVPVRHFLPAGIQVLQIAVDRLVEVQWVLPSRRFFGLGGFFRLRWFFGLGGFFRLFRCLRRFLGRRLGKLFSRKMELIGGLILIAIGIKIVIEHLAA